MFSATPLRSRLTPLVTLAGGRVLASGLAREHSADTKRCLPAIKLTAGQHRKPLLNSLPIFTNAPRGSPSSTKASRSSNWNSTTISTERISCYARIRVGKMGTNRYDVVVVGAGLSGLVAAGVAAHRQLKIALGATGPGSFVAGPGWLKAQEILRASAAPALGEAIAYLCELACLADCPYTGDISTARFLPSVLGEFHSVALAPHTLWNAEPRAGISTAIVGIRGLSGFDENFMAERLTEQARLIGSSCSYAVRQISFSRDVGIPVTALRIAECFDRDAAFRTELIHALREVASGFARILVPGILGLESSAEQIAE